MCGYCGGGGFYVTVGAGIVVDQVRYEEASVHVVMKEADHHGNILVVADKLLVGPIRVDASNLSEVVCG